MRVTGLRAKGSIARSGVTPLGPRRYSLTVERPETRVMKQKIYPGIHNEPQGGMTPTANIIRDAWVFGLLPEEETCEGWTSRGIEDLYDKVHAAWKPYGHLVSHLPPELAERHARIYGAAVEHARAAGWDPDLSDEI